MPWLLHQHLDYSVGGESRDFLALLPLPTLLVEADDELLVSRFSFRDGGGANECVGGPVFFAVARDANEVLRGGTIVLTFGFNATACARAAVGGPR